MPNHKNMEEENFYAFRKSIKHQRKIQFDKDHWNDLQSRLDNNKTIIYRPALGWWSFAAAIAFLLLLGNVLLFKNLQEARKMNNELESRLNTFAPKPEADTIVREKIVYDTITEIKVVYQNKITIPKNSEELQQVLAAEEIESLLPNKKSPIKPKPKPLIEKTGEDNEEEFAGSSIDASENQDEAKALFSDSQLALLPYRQLGILSTNYFKEIPDRAGLLEGNVLKKRKSSFFTKFKRAMQPNGFAIGAGGWVLFPISKDLHELNGWSSGISGELVFSDNLRLRAEANYSHIGYSSEEMNEDLGIPLISSPGDNYEFDHANVTLNGFHFNAGMLYFLSTGKNFRPFLTAGIGTVSGLPYKVNYNFENTLEDGEDIQIENEIPYANTKTGFGLIGAGVSYTINDQLDIRMEGFYRTQLNKSSTLYPDLAGLKTTVSFQF